VPDRQHQATVRAEFERAAAGFAERSKGRFDAMDVIDFARVEPDATVLEVGSGTGNFLSLFEGVASSCIGVDLTFGMLEQARRRYPSQLLVQGDGESLPLASTSVDLATCAQMIHHVWDPLPLVKELRRVAGRGGRVLIVDQVATERFEEATRMSQLETVRDPSHAVSRPRSGYLTMVRAAGLEVIDERIFEDRSRFSKWMWSNEFDEERIDATRRFVEQHGHETGMGFEKDGDDYVFTRRRIMILAQRT
jgi:ubiquinone/menaquinone biosynthesis C-methylase UbiE